MLIRPFLYAVLLSAPGIAAASDGLILGMVYQCDADAINRDMIEACSVEFPDLAPQANDAYASWRERNAVKASAAKKACFSNLAEKADTASADETAAVNKLMADAKTEIRTGFETRMRSEGKPACVASLKQLNTAGGPLDIH
jgi:hypothetical protein